MKVNVNSSVQVQTSFEEIELQDDYAVQQEEEAGELLAGKNYNAIVTATDWTVETLLLQLNKKNISLDPSFQRRDAWTAKRKSEFIESLFMGLPVPQVVLAESKDRKGAYIVLDGKQRLLTLRQFSAKQNDTEFSQLRLSGLVLRPELNNKAYEDIVGDVHLQDDLSFFENYTIRTVVLRNWPSEEYLYLVFLRLNSGSLSLSTQELRQVVSPGPFTRFANTFTSQSAVIMGLFNSKSQPDFRMRDVELTIRYFGLANILSKYAGNLKLFLDQTCADLNVQWVLEEQRLRSEGVELEKAIEATLEIFEGNAFNKWNGTGFERRFNRAVFDTMIYYFREENVRLLAVQKKNEVVTEFKRLCTEDESFKGALESTTKSISALITRLAVWGNSLENLLHAGTQIPTLDPQINRIIP
jgi:hypothetical protein